MRLAEKSRIVWEYGYEIVHAPHYWPALAEAIGMKRPGNAVRTCMIKVEVASRTYYVPHSEYDFENPPLRSNLRRMIELVEEADSNEYRKEENTAEEMGR